MRVRINFTVDFDLENYRRATNQPEITMNEARTQIQDDALEGVMSHLTGSGVRASSLGRNNAYDPETRQTIHEEYVAST